MKYKYTLLTILFTFFQYTANCQTYIDYYKKSIEAYKEADYNAFLEHTKEANNLRPNHPQILYNLAGAYALNNNPEKAFEILNYRSHFFANNDFQNDEDFSQLKNFDEWSALLSSIDHLNKKTTKSIEAFNLQMNGFHPEGITYNKSTSRFIIGDIRNGLIYSFDKNGKDKKLIIDLKAEGFWSAMGMAINNNTLWVTTSALPQFSEFERIDNPKAAVLKINLNTGKIQSTFVKEGDHIFGDLVISATNDVYITDSVEPVIYKINNQQDKLTEFARNKSWWNLQGLALSDDDNKLYVADYIKGIYVIDLTNPETPLPLISDNEWLRGGDGIYQKNNRLIVLQNGTSPNRVAQIKLDNEGWGISSSLQFIDQASEILNEPTLGTWVEDEFYYIANSPWGYYSDNNEPLLEEWPIIKIYKYTVN